MRRCSGLVLVLAVLGSMRGTAQQSLPADSLTHGARVRVMRVQATGRTELARGDFQRLTGDTVVLMTGDSLVHRVLGGDGVLQVRTGRKRSTIAGALVGAAVGIAIGAAVGAGQEPSCPGGCIAQGVTTAASASGFGLGGMLLGGLIGSQMVRETWRPVGVPRRIALAWVPSARGVSLGATLRF